MVKPKCCVQCVSNGGITSPSRVLLVVTLVASLSVIVCSEQTENCREIMTIRQEREYSAEIKIQSEEGRRGGECPTWTLHASNESHHCYCGDSLDGTVRCNPTTHNVFIKIQYCMTHDYTNQVTYVAECPYDNKRKAYRSQYISLPQNVSELNSAMCTPFNRQGRVCGRCMPGYGPGVLSEKLNCYRCSGPYHGWGLYLFLKLFPLTLFFLIIILFQFRATSGSVKCYIFLAQMIIAVYQFLRPDGSYPFGEGSSYFITAMLVFYGFWNLDIFAELMPPFCVSEHITGLHAVVLQYVPVVYLLLLTALALLLIELHARNYRVIVYLWKPIHKYYVRMHRTINPYHSIIDAFATIIILAYSRIIISSYRFFHSSKLYTSTGKVAGHIVFFAGDINYFSSQHIPFVVLAVFMLVPINIFPVVFLLLYPCKWFQRILGRFRRVSQMLHPIADTFQGCYRNGADGGRDYRYFAALYIILRISIYTICDCVEPPTSWFLYAILFLIVSIIFARLKPYRDDRLNVVDCVFCALVSICLFSQSLVAAGGVTSKRPYQIVTQLICLIPAVYIIGFAICSYVLIPLQQKVRLRRQERGANDLYNEEHNEEELPYRLLVNGHSTEPESVESQEYLPNIGSELETF